MLERERGTIMKMMTITAMLLATLFLAGCTLEDADFDKFTRYPGGGTAVRPDVTVEQCGGTIGTSEATAEACIKTCESDLAQCAAMCGNPKNTDEKATDSGSIPYETRMKEACQSTCENAGENGSYSCDQYCSATKDPEVCNPNTGKPILE